MPESKNRKPRHKFTAELKSQIIQLYQNGKRKCDIINKLFYNLFKTYNYYKDSN